MKNVVEALGRIKVSTHHEVTESNVIEERDIGSRDLGREQELTIVHVNRVEVFQCAFIVSQTDLQKTKLSLNY